MAQTAQSDPIQEFIALPRDQQMSTLQQLAPDKQDKLLEKVKEYRSGKPLAESGTPPQKPGVLEGIERGKNDVINVFRPLSAEERGGIESTMGKYPGAAFEGVSNATLGVASAGANLLLHPLGSVYGTAQLAADALNQLFPDSGLNPQQKAAKQASLERLKSQWEQIKENPDWAMGNIVGGIEAGRAIGDAVGPVTKGLMEKAGKLRESVRGTAQSLAGAGSKVVEEQVGKTATSAGEAAKATEEGNRTALAKHEQDLREAAQKNVNAHVKYLADKADAEQTNAAAKAIPDARAGLESYVDNKLEEADVRTEKARHDALVEGNKKYNGVNSELDPYEADPEKMSLALADASEAVTGKDPPLLKEFDERLTGYTKAGEPKGPLTYDELQGFYSKLGNALSKGTLDGETYHIYDVMHDAVGDEMQRIADEHGQGAALKDARNYWRRMKQAFGKSSDTINNRASKAVAERSSDFTDAQADAYRLRLLDSFDPGISPLLRDADAANERLSKLPTDATRPKAETPTYPEEKTVQPPKTKAVEVPEVNTRAMREELVRKWARGESGLNKFQVARLIGSAGLGTVIGAIFGHGAGAEVGSAVGTAAYALSPAIVAKIISNPGVMEFLSRPPAGEIDALAKLPYADRIKLTDGLKQVAQAAQRKGIKVDPALAAMIGATAVRGPKAQKIQQTRDEWYATHAR